MEIKYSVCSDFFAKEGIDMTRKVEKTFKYLPELDFIPAVGTYLFIDSYQFENEQMWYDIRYLYFKVTEIVIGVREGVQLVGVALDTPERYTSLDTPERYTSLDTPERYTSIKERDTVGNLISCTFEGIAL